jgi:hypothetical protein
MGVAPEALEEYECSCKVFPHLLSVCEVLVSAGFGSVSTGLGSVGRMCDIHLCLVHVQEV